MENLDSNVDPLAGLDWEVDSQLVQRQKLLDIQTRHNDRMRHPDTDIYSTAFYSKDLTDEQRDIIDDTTLITVHLELDKNENQREYASYKIRFATPNTDYDGLDIAPRTSYVEVARYYRENGMLFQNDEFSTEQVMEIFMMLDELFVAGKKDIPDLSKSKSTIPYRITNESAG